MKTRNYLFIALYVFAPLLLMGQFQSDVQLNYGYSNGLFKDYNYSPLHYSERGHRIDLGIVRRKFGSAHMFHLDISPKLHSLHHKDYSYLKSLLLGGNAAMGYDRLVMEKSDRLEIFVGLEYELEINFVDFLGLESYTWLFRHGLNTKFSSSYALSDRSQLRLTLGVPLFHILNRPPYNGVDKYIIEEFENNLAAFALTGSLTSWSNYAFADFRIQYLFQLSPRWKLTSAYAASFRRVFDATRYTQLSNQFQLGINFTL